MATPPQFTTYLWLWHIKIAYISTSADDAILIEFLSKWMREESKGLKVRSLPGTTDLPSRYKLKAFISHKGPSVHSGHYIAHIRMEDEWVLFNDEKVVKADKESVDDLKKLAYLYFFERV